MKVKTLLATLRNTEYILTNVDGWTLEHEFISNKYYGESAYEDLKVVEIKTIKDNDILFIKAK